MQHPTYGISLGNYLVREETRPCQHSQPYSTYVCTSLAPRPMTVVFGLGTKLSVRMRRPTTLENGVLRNRQQPGRAENSFIDQEFVAMKTMSCCKAPLCDENQFHDKMTVRT